MKKLMIMLLLSLVLITIGCTESSKRNLKSIKSNWVGLERTIYVYDYNGNLLKSYKGHIDLDNTDGSKTLFDLNDKRIIIKNAIVIVEEN